MSSTFKTRKAGHAAIARPVGRAGTRDAVSSKSSANSETASIVKPAVEMLNRMPGVWAMRVNSGVAKMGSGHIRLAPEGTADIMATVDGRTIWFEGKKPGEKLSPAQKAFADRVCRAGARYFVITEARQAMVIARDYQRGTLDGDG